mmetsp:Transcript_125201/g.389757  ORF Transcript_125201/g.389757 Transcript_125201/m.389757 type:complete len:159 (-) Transcript_125201:157-633(-)
MPLQFETSSSTASSGSQTPRRPPVPGLSLGASQRASVGARVVGYVASPELTILRSRVFDTGLATARGRWAAPPPSTRSTAAARDEALAARFGVEPSGLASAGAVRPRYNKLKTFTGSPMMQSTVDQVVFNRDMDFSGETKFDEEFVRMFDSCAGKPSW